MTLPIVPLLVLIISFTYTTGALAQGQYVSNCNSTRSKKIAIVGEDDRFKPGTKSNDSKLQSVGVIACRKENSSPTDPFNVLVGTATLVENHKTIITTGHQFLRDDGYDLITIEKNCRFLITDKDGNVLRSVGISSKLRTKDRSRMGIGHGSTIGYGGEKNIQNDWVVFSLNAPQCENYPYDDSLEDLTPFAVARGDNPINIKSTFSLCGFNKDDAESKYIRRCLKGPYANNGQDVPLMRNNMAILHPIDTYFLTSGAPLFIERNGIPTVFGINVGGKCDVPGQEYNIETCFNYGIFFSELFYKALDVKVEETGGSIYGPPKLQKTKFITPKPANPNREVST